MAIWDSVDLNQDHPAQNHPSQDDAAQDDAAQDDAAQDDAAQDHPGQAEALRAALADQRSAAELRRALDSEPGYHPGLHARLAGDLRLSGWTIPEEFGGLGKSQVEACSIHTELGRVLYPGPFLPSAVAAGALLATGHRSPASGGFRCWPPAR
jgi:alkylation response protein AidB-like acyl-CoA dehydrogenase